MDCTLSSLISPARKEALAAAVRLRTSCRSYAGEPLAPAELATLSYHTGRFALPGARLSLVRTDDACFTGAAAWGKPICWNVSATKRGTGAWNAFLPPPTIFSWP